MEFIGCRKEIDNQYSWNNNGMFEESYVSLFMRHCDERFFIFFNLAFNYILSLSTPEKREQNHAYLWLILKLSFPHSFPSHS